MRTNLLFTLLLSALIITPFHSSGQNFAAKDTVPIGVVFRELERNIDCRIYSDAPDTVRVVVNKNETINLQTLESALENTAYTVSEYGNILFVVQGASINTMPAFTRVIRSNDNAPDTYRSGTEFFGEATSENRVYAIGDPYTRDAPETIVLTGKVTNAKTGEELIGVSIGILNTNKGTATDANGNYCLELPSGQSLLNLSAFNIKSSRRQIMAYDDGVFNIGLVEEVVELDEVTIIASRVDQVKNAQIGLEKIQVDRIKNIPTALGEVDILKVIQTLPGVKTVGETSSGYNVRGGAADQNLILLNGGTVYNPNHLFGLFTVFSPDLVDEAELYKSSIPAKYGGRISSVLDLTGKEASKEEFVGSASLGIVSSKLTLETPISKGNSSLLVTGRTTYSDWMLRTLPEKSGYKNGKAGFYDWGATFSQKINEMNQLNFFVYNSRDRFTLTEGEKYVYTNINASAKWRNIINEHFFGNYSIGYDYYDYKNESTTDIYSASKLAYNINQYYAKADFSYILEDHNVDFGVSSMFYNTLPGKFTPFGRESSVMTTELQKEKALESAIYISDEWSVTPEILLNAGVRYTLYNALGPKTWTEYDPDFLPQENTVAGIVETPSGDIYKTYHGPEFRLAGRYLINSDLSVKMGFNSMKQYIHRLTNSLIMSPTDIWKLSDANIKPQKGWQLATGLYYNAPGRRWEASAEVYYKLMDDYLDYRGGAVLLMNPHIETEVLPTEGKAYGIELALKKPVGRLNGWVSYTFSRTFLRQIDAMIENPVNNRDWYPTDYDKPHDFKLVGNYKFTRRYSLSVNVDYSTGRPTTIPAGQYYDPQQDASLVYYTDRNSYRIPDYFRTDISFNIEPSHKLTLLTHSSISFGIYNVTGRKNVYSIYFESDGTRIRGYKLSIFGAPIPFASYNIRF